MRKIYNINELEYLILFIFLFLQSILSEVSLIFSYSDELFACWGLWKFIQQPIRSRIWNEYPGVMKIIRLALFVVIVGWAGTIVNRIQPSLNSNLMDCFTLLKIFLIFFLSVNLLRKCNFNRIIETIYGITSIYILSGFIFLILSQFIDVGMSFEKRFGFNDFKFINPNPGDYSSILIISLVIFHISSFYMKKTLLLMKAITLILILFTFRGKSIGFIATYLMVVFFINRYNKISRKSLFVLAFLGILGGYFQIRYYFLDNVTPRALFLVNGITTANDFFPLGAGYSTFGSNMAKINYSPLYEKYGFDQVWGMNQEEQQFLNDNFWPMIMGQYGWIGLLLYVGILLLLFKIINVEIANKQLKIAGFSIFFLLLYSSVGGPIFVHYIGCASIIVFSLILKGNKSNNIHSVTSLKRLNSHV